ncbi:MAG: HlyD family efflux transporter periplasmic adaptor subunit [Candidatus Omnitrophica bacterium]|jgi:macrolide-specific efflux system membrane fusion protein|nr:HlyD family efflux transporter periplasmic adaptor subunit [Candidatus Omnitrophota bacterium]
MNKKLKISLVLTGVLIIAVFIVLKLRPKVDTDNIIKEISPAIGTIETVISTTGSILPKNRLEIKPPVNGRVESVLVKEGQKVKIGDTLAWMSSTERAALLDAAMTQGKEKLEYWQEAYKPIALLSPIDAEVIVATTLAGQTVTTADAVVVLSDELIARAQVDETDIGKIKLGQKAVIILDAYPDDRINAVVEHIYYESKTVNNVTIYEVDLIPESIPEFFRSGMNTTIDFIENSKKDILLLPVEAVYKNKEESFVLIKKDGQGEFRQQPVKVGISDDKNVEVISGVSEKDILVLKNKKFVLPKSDMGSSPFTPFGAKKDAAKKK